MAIMQTPMFDYKVMFQMGNMTNAYIELTFLDCSCH